jgi:recombination DNA repair RAD52 pathway protein
MKALQIEKSIKNKIIEPIPQELIKQREGGGKKLLSYLSGSTVNDMLNNAFGYMWNWEVKQFWIQESQPYYNKYVNGKRESDPSKWIREDQGPVAHVLGTLTVYLENENGNIIEVKKDGFGSKSVLGKQNDQESIFKAAGTDALKKAASLLGIGLSLYRDEEEQYYFDTINYEDPWTDELKEKYSEELSYIREYINKYEVPEEEFDQYVFAVTGEQSYSVLPDNIELIVNSIKEELEKSE